MKGFIIFTLILGFLFNTLSVGGQIWSFGSVSAIVLMGVYIKEVWMNILKN